MPSRSANTPVTMRFSANLRRLVAKCSSSAHAARELDISRAQFNRFLSGDAHPKPVVLKRICDYFGVDARILTDELPDVFIETLPTPGTAHVSPLRNFGLENAVHFLPPSASHFVPQDELPDGLYLYWRLSMRRADTYICSTFQLKSLAGARVLRCFVLRSSIVQTDTLPPKLRELRGILFGVEDGYAWFFASAPAWNNVSMNFTSRAIHRYSKFYSGFYALARNEAVGQNRIGRCVIERLPSERNSIVRAAHATRYYDETSLPEAVRYELLRPLA